MKKKLFVFAFFLFIQISTSQAKNLYYGIDVDEIYNNGDWSHKEDITQLIDSYILLQKIKKDFTSCPQEIPDSTICYENITKYLLQNFYKNFDTDWENYLQFKALAEKIYAVIFCENKFSDIGGTMCDIDTQIRVADVLRDYTTTLLHSTEKFFDDYHYFLHNCK